MQVQFQTVLFNSDDFKFAIVLENSLVIVTTKGELELEYKSEAEALTAQVELGEVLDSVKKTDIGSVVDTIKDAAETVSVMFGSLLGSTSKVVKAKVSPKAKNEVLDDVEERVNSILSTITKFLDSDKEEPDTTEKSKSAVDDAESVFGTRRSAAGQKPGKPTASVHSIISDLSDDELKQVIHEKAEQLMRSNRQVQELVDQLHAFHSEDEVLELIQAHKDMVFRIARANDHLSVNEIFDGLLN